MKPRSRSIATLCSLPSLARHQCSKLGFVCVCACVCACVLACACVRACMRACGVRACVRARARAHVCVCGGPGCFVTWDTNTDSPTLSSPLQLIFCRDFNVFRKYYPNTWTVKKNAICYYSLRSFGVVLVQTLDTKTTHTKQLSQKQISILHFIFTIELLFCNVKLTLEICMMCFVIINIYIYIYFFFKPFMCLDLVVER